MERGNSGWERGNFRLGIAPHFDAYRQPLPIWLRWWQGDEVSIGYALASFVVTWAVVYGQMRLLRRHRAPKATKAA